MTLASPRERAALAFAELDAVNDASLGRPTHPGTDARKDRALRNLAAAMNAEFGPLTDPAPIIEVERWEAE